MSTYNNNPIDSARIQTSSTHKAFTIIINP